MSRVVSKVRSALSRVRRALPGGRPDLVRGHCPICERAAVFRVEGPWLRDQFVCTGCGSIPRWRAVVHVLGMFFPDWRKLAVHESSPGGAASDKIARECGGCVQTHYFPGVPGGQSKDGFRCEDLESQTFPDAAFDVVVTQDVFEHIPDPARGFAEVARTLKPGGAHVFTIPWYHWKPTLVRAERAPDGSVRHLKPPDYHGNPIDDKGSLVFREWGSDVCDFVYRASGLTTTVVRIRDRHLGIDAEFIEVFVSRKAGGPPA
jgi:SAM-dependent methyltransferase